MKHTPFVTITFILVWMAVTYAVCLIFFQGSIFCLGEWFDIGDWNYLLSDSFVTQVVVAFLSCLVTIPLNIIAVLVERKKTGGSL